MSKKEGQPAEEAIIHVTGIELNPTSGEVRINSHAIGTSSEAMDAAAVALGDFVGASDVEEVTPPNFSGTQVARRSFSFSEKAWTAPWQPTGPKPIWAEKANPNEPIN